ncbi:MAG: hypothetical protein JXB34_12185 [Bacteroidales bacterium]|nr:hypothetical protein [Bacteroidales bacterium]
MRNYYWTLEELNILEEWDWVSKYTDARQGSEIPDAEIVRKLTLEARLILSDKLVIVYSGNSSEPFSIVSFKELLSIIEKNKERGMRVLFHPVNFKTLVEFRAFLSQIRERMFLLLN